MVSAKNVGTSHTIVVHTNADENYVGFQINRVYSHVAEEYEEIKEIGRGSFASVFLCRHRLSG